jgi:hypothetical protein
MRCSTAAASTAVCATHGSGKWVHTRERLFQGLLIYPPMADNMIAIEFIETPTFTRMITALLTDDEYWGLQYVLMENPERGEIIQGGGGIRKLRYAVQGRGKSGGIRVIYYWIKDNDQIYMLVAYPKSKKDDLTDKETAVLRRYVKEL